MSCLTNNATKIAGRVFCVVTALLFLLTLMIFAFGLMHKSDQQQILNRYSFSYFLLLLGLFAVLACLSWIIFKGGPRLERWTTNLYVFLISTLIVLLLVEWGLRVFNPFGVEFFHLLPYHMQGMVDDPQLGYRHPESVNYMLGTKQVIINEHGLRDEDIPFIKPENEKRILMLGDSVTFGWGVSQGESFSDQMEPLLREQTGDQWQVINAGVNGYNTEQEAFYLHMDGMRYSPDIVLLIYVSNDVDPAINPNEAIWRRYPAWPPSLPEAINRLLQLSYLNQLTHLFVRMHEMDEARTAAIIGNDPTSRGENRSMIGHPNWPRSKTALMDIAQQCREAGIPFLVGLYSSLDGGYDPEFVDELQQEGVDTIHLQPAWEDVPEGEAHVSRIDSHPSALVHVKIADYLVEVIRERGWLDAP